MDLLSRLLLLVLLSALPVQQAAALEVNYWPFFTGERDAEEGALTSWESIGPLVFGKETEAAEIFGVRPLFVHFRAKERDRTSFHVLYPLFNHRSTPRGNSWDIFNTVRYNSFSPTGREASRTLHLFPFFFLRLDPESPERGYFGIFPIAGQVQGLFGYDRITWFPFPFARFERGDATTVAMPWPFLRFTHGEGISGHHFWPLYGYSAREGEYERRYWLWPLGYRVRQDLWKEEPFEAFGFLPFYARSRSDKAISESFIWPFFGYTESFQPEYRENRYFWPLFVQRRGASYINRWAPFYTHSIRRGVDKRWVMWPVYRNETWQERELVHDKTQVLFFLYWNLKQTSAHNPDLPSAVKRHVWPFYSSWDNGAGRRQLQALSPFEVFFPYNEVVREKYSPLFALYRMDREEGVRARHSLLWNFITWERQEEEKAFRLNVGPIVSYAREPQKREVQVLKGLLSYARTGEGRRIRFFWRDAGDRSRDAEPLPSSDE